MKNSRQISSVLAELYHSNKIKNLLTGKRAVISSRIIDCHCEVIIKHLQLYCLEVLMYSISFQYFEDEVFSGDM